MKPMLAAPSDGSNLKYPLMVSPKLDGVRCLIINGVAMSRNLKPIPNRYIQSLIGTIKLDWLDGELIVGDETSKTVYNDTVSGVMSRDGEPNFIFRVFDNFAVPNNPFTKRYSSVIQRSKSLPKHFFNFVDPVSHIIITEEQELVEWEHNFLSYGYEGIMIRHPNGLYKHGRSTLKEGWLLKVKRFEDSEAEILGFEQLMINTNTPESDNLGYQKRSSKKIGKVGAQELGALMVRDLKTGIEFNIGSGFTSQDRFDIWKNKGTLKGVIVKYKFQPVGVKEKPRFPVFLGFRHPIDL